MAEHVYLISISLPIVAVLLVFAMRYWSAVQQARIRLALDDAYRQLAEKSAAAQSQSAASLASMEAALADLKTRVAGIEKVLKEVE